MFTTRFLGIAIPTLAVPLVMLVLGVGEGHGQTRITPYGNVTRYGGGYRGPIYRPYYPYYGWGGYGWGGGYYYAPNYNYNYYYPPVSAPGYTVPPATGFSGGLSTYSSGYYSPPARPSDKAEIDVTLPADAELYIQGQKMTQTGPRRQFISPSLEAGHTYTYTVRATWMQNGKEVSQEQRVRVQPGDQKSILFLDTSAN